MNSIKKMLKRLKWWKFWSEYFSYKKLLDEKKRILEIGVGMAKISGVFTIDINPSVNPDILHDLDKFPWPIDDSSYDVVVMFSVVEHLSQPIKAIEECYRILKSSGKIYILTPHFSDAGSYIDPSHKWHLSGRSFDYFIPGTALYNEYSFYSFAQFNLNRRLISLKGFLDKVPFLQSFVNRNLAFYEDYLCFIVRGAGIYIELEKIDTKNT